MVNLVSISQNLGHGLAFASLSVIDLWVLFLHLGLLSAKIERTLALPLVNLAHFPRAEYIYMHCFVKTLKSRISEPWASLEHFRTPVYDTRSLILSA
ncbi:hypothetical protein EV424DRAFT_1437554 [Suillus variegatus]|nr:hypothetical protein EV424DRAFT_1437554 [Suillus variegatus]